jgi:hypothetical protein
MKNDDDDFDFADEPADDEGSWRRIDVHDPADVAWLEAQATAVADEMRSQAEAAIRRIGGAPDAVQWAGDRAADFVMQKHRESLASLTRRSTH